ncbi:hypothetical protein ACFL96_09030 [Thermoproteota archaeon]
MRQQHEVSFRHKDPCKKKKALRVLRQKLPCEGAYIEGTITINYSPAETLEF